MTNGCSFDRSDWFPLLSLLLIGGIVLGCFALHAYRFTAGQGGVPLDDAWIHFQFARNLARGDGFSFNPGKPTAGSTSPLWTILLAAAYRLGGRFPAAGQMLTAISFLASLAAVYGVGKQLTGRRWAAWLAGAVVAVNGRMVWAALSALEICLFATLSLLAIAVHIRNQSMWRSGAPTRLRPRHIMTAAVLFGLAALTRPEGYLLFAIALADLASHALHITPHTSRITHYASRLALFVIPFVAIIAPYMTFSLKTTGHLLPNTYHAKAVFDFWPDRNFLSLAARYLILDNPFLLPFFVLGIGALFRRGRLLSLWAVGLPIVYAFLHVALYQHGRYLIPLIPCNAIIGIAGLLEGMQMLTIRAPRLNIKPCLLCILAIIGTGWRLPFMADQYARNVDNINEMHVALGHWVAENTPPDALIALNDIGAIAYISERPVMDLAGLVTPEIIPLLRRPDRDARLADLMAERRVQYAILFPSWFPGLANCAALEPIYQVTLEHNTIAGGKTMVVYLAHWQR